MLYSLEWLQPGKPFPPVGETERIIRCKQNRILFDGEHFDDHSKHLCEIYEYAIQRMLATCEQYTNDIPVCYPILLNYQKLISLKKADLVCGESPDITGNDANVAYNDTITQLREDVDFDNKLYATVIDLSRYGDAIWRKYKREDGKGDFTVWQPDNWYPIVMPDGTNRVTAHVLAWRWNAGTIERPLWRLTVQIHPTSGGYYTQREFNMNEVGGVIGSQIGTDSTVVTGFDSCAVEHIASITTSGTVYGYDDYMPVDSLLCEIMTRLAQISTILDKHASPAMTGPASMLTQDAKTGERYLKKGSFYATSPGEMQPAYLTWDGQLDAAFKELDELLKQLYILSEMGDSILGQSEGSGQAISGTAMRFKMAAPLITVRRLTNVLTKPIKQLLHDITTVGRSEIPINVLSISWNDGLPNDPREEVEIAKLATGVPDLMPVEEAIQTYLHKSVKTSTEWRNQILADMSDFGLLDTSNGSTETGADNPNANPPGDPQGATKNPTVDPRAKGSQTGVSNFHGLNNK